MTKQGLPDLPKAQTAGHAAENCLDFFSRLQLPTGHWACEFGGPAIMTPGVVIALYATGLPLKGAEQVETIRYVLNLQNEDGGWGVHITGDSTASGTALHYVTLRLLGVSPRHSRMQKARSCLQDIGDVLYNHQIAKFWLAVLGVLPWEIVNPIPPEVWLLPDWAPVSPSKWWVYARAVHLSMSFIWSHQWTYPGKDDDPLILELRQELLNSPQPVSWTSYRGVVHRGDDYHTTSWVLAVLYWFLISIYIPYFRTDRLIQRAEARVFHLIQIEDENTDQSCIASIVAPMTLIVYFIREGLEGDGVRAHRERLEDFMWMSKYGMGVNTTNGVQTWDTALAIQAITATGLASHPRFYKVMSTALEFLDDHQMDHTTGFENSSAFSDPPTIRTSLEVGYRQVRKGAWGFSDKRQGYPVSDCTAEALKSVLLLQSMIDPADPTHTKHLYPQRLSEQRLKWAVDILLVYQNATGGTSCYEVRRVGTWIECLNPSQMFDKLMTSFDHVECTGSCLTALYLFHQKFPKYRATEICTFIERATAFIRTAQRPDGSWYGFWGICFTYAAYFAIGSLASQGETYSNSDTVHRACEFLLDKQNDDGGWGESHQSCVTEKWCDNVNGSQVVQTAWVVIALMDAKLPYKEPIERGIGLLMSRQQPNGEFLQEDLEGAHQRSW
jgi:lanosterol synthase